MAAIGSNRPVLGGLPATGKPRVVRKAKQKTTGTVVLPAKGKAAPKPKAKTFSNGAPYRDVNKGEDVYRVYPGGKMKRLTPAKAAGKKTTVAAAPVDPYAQAVEAGTAQKFGPAEQGLTAEQRANAQRLTDSKGWFAQYQAEIARANQAAADTGARVQQGMAAFTNALTANDASGASGVTAQMQADAAARGAVADPAAGERAIQAAAVRRENNAGLGDLLGINVAANAERGRGSAVNASSQKLQSIIDNGRAASKILERKTQLEKDKGDFKVTYKRQLESDAMDQALKEFLTKSQTSVAEQNAATKAAAAAQSAKDKEQRRIIARQKAKDAKERDDYLRAHKLGQYRPNADPSASPAEKRAADKDAYQRAHHTGPYALPSGKKGAKGKSPYLATAGQNTAKDAIDGAVVDGRKLKASYSESEVRALLLNGRAAQTVEKDGKKLTIPAVPKHSKRWVNVAMDILYRDGISQPNVAALHKAGVKVNALGYPVLKKGAKKPEPSASVVSNTLANLGIG